MMLFFMNFKHKFVIMQFSFSNRWVKIVEELIHNECLAAARITPEVDAFEFCYVFVFVCWKYFLRLSKRVDRLRGLLLIMRVLWSYWSSLTEKVWKVAFNSNLLITCVLLNCDISDTSQLKHNLAVKNLPLYIHFYTKLSLAAPHVFAWNIPQAFRADNWKF